MARQARDRSNIGVYHVMLRGIDKRDIFLDDEDRRKFIKCVMSAKEIGNFEMYAYCLMDNHVHLLLKEGEEIGESIKRISVRYVRWHNNKYERTGHLFQNRFRSEAVETEGYLISVSRYIHQNPMKAGMVNRLEDYQWSSFRQYLRSYQGVSSYIDAEMIKSYFPKVEDFINHVNTENIDEFLDYQLVYRYNDDNLRNKISERYRIDRIGNLHKKERNKTINKIYCESGASVRQLSRVLGVGKTIVENAIKKDR